MEVKMDQNNNSKLPINPEHNSDLNKNEFKDITNNIRQHHSITITLKFTQKKIDINLSLN